MLQVGGGWGLGVAVQHGFAGGLDAQADKAVVAELFYAAVFFCFFADCYVFVVFGVWGGHGVSFGGGFQAAFGVGWLVIYADGFAVAGLLPVVAPCGEVVGGLAGEGGGESEGLGEAVGKGGGAGEVAQADGYGEAVGGGEGGLGKVGHGWRALEEVLMVILKSLYIGEQKRQPEKSQQKINGICIKTDAVYFNNELRRFMPFCFNRQAH